MRIPAIRFIATLFLVLGALGVYHVVAVPILERPPPEMLNDIAHLEPYHPPVQRFQPLLAALFPEGSWERGDVRVLKTNDVLLVVGQHESLPGGKLRVHPVSIVLCEEGLEPLLAADRELAPETRVWTIRAPGGAVLQFDEEVQLEKGGIGKLLSGIVQGNVTITGRQPRLPESDPIELLAENLEFDGRRLFSNAEVHLRWGSSQASGRDLTVMFADPQDRASSRLPGTRTTSLESLSLSQLQRLHLILPPDSIGGLAGDPTAVGQPLRIDAGSDGPLHVDFTRGLAELRDAVWFAHPRSDGGQDDLRCERASVTFSGNTKGEAPGGGGLSIAMRVPSCRFDRVSLAGHPVVVTSKAGDMILAQPLPVRSLRLEGGELHHELAGTEGLRIVGPGLVQVELEGDGVKTFSAHWKKGLMWHRLEQEEVIVVEEEAAVALEPMGSLSAEAIRASLRRSDTQVATGGVLGSPSALQPRSLSAKGGVRLLAPGFQGTTEQLELEFRQGVAPAASLATDSTGPQIGNARSARDSQTRSGQGTSKTFQVHGQRIQGVLLIADKQPLLDSLNITGQVRAASIPQEATHDAPVELKAESFEAHDLVSGRGGMLLRGQPAQIRARQIDISGGSIHLEQATNLCWMEGPGSATLPLPESIARQTPSYPPIANVTWRNGLEFDGQTLKCHEEVTVRGPMQLLRCSTLAMALDRRVPFSEAPTGLGQCNLATTTASGGVFVENRTVDARGTRSIDQAQVESLSISHRDGAVKGVGPGWMQSVSVGSKPLPSAAPRPTGSAESGLALMQVQFKGDLRGNLQRRQIQIANQVMAIYSPVRDWADRVDPNQPGGLPAEAVVLHCEEMEAMQSPLPTAGVDSYELTALGNTVIEGRSFKATGHRVSYDKGKDLMVLEGTDRAHARLWYQDPKGDKTLENSAKKIEYWPKRNIVKGEVNFLEFTTTGK